MAGGMVAVRCPVDLAPLMRRAGARQRPFVPPLSYINIRPAAARRARLGLGTARGQQTVSKDAGPPSPGPQHDQQDHHARPHRHLDLPLQAPAAEAEGGPVEGPAIVTPKPKAAPAIVQQDVKPGNDNRPEGPKARIVQATKPKRRRKVWADDGQQETEPEIKALIGRMMLGRGPSNST